MRKTAVISVITALVLALVSVGCGKRLTLDFGEVGKIEVFSSSGEWIDTVDGEVIEHITDNLEEIKFSRDGEADTKLTEKNYTLRLYDPLGSQTYELTVISPMRIIYDGYLYSSMEADAEIDMEYYSALISGESN